MKLFDTSGKIAIVTGGSQGIGFAISKGLASSGATVIIANRRVEEGQKAVRYLKENGFNNATAVPTDVSSISSISELVSKVVSDFGRIDILVNNAGIVMRKPPEDITEEDWDAVMNTNLKGLFFCCQLAGREMIRNKKGKIINISSVVAQVAHRGRSVYATSKAGVSHLTRALALEWAKYNINVNAIGPSATITPLAEKHLEQNPDEMKPIIDAIPMGRMGYPEDFVGTTIFLASDASAFVTGQTLLVDGGFTLSPLE